MELIDRDALLQDMTQRGGDEIADWHVFDIIAEQPTIEAEPVKHGEWIPMHVDCRGYTGIFDCTACGMSTFLEYCAKECEYDFCPNCGAAMAATDKNVGDKGGEAR